MQFCHWLQFIANKGFYYQKLRLKVKEVQNKAMRVAEGARRHSRKPIIAMRSIFNDISCESPSSTCYKYQKEIFAGTFDIPREIGIAVKNNLPQFSQDP